MTKDIVSFQTRARTIDHLGRGQIADLPTAITELWKNAYDAYAQNVSLHIFAGSPGIATIFDDGCGMTRDDFIKRWLVIGTETKIDSEPETDEERQNNNQECFFSRLLRRKKVFNHVIELCTTN